MMLGDPFQKAGSYENSESVNLDIRETLFQERR